MQPEPSVHNPKGAVGLECLLYREARPRFDCALTKTIFKYIMFP